MCPGSPPNPARDHVLPGHRGAPGGGSPTVWGTDPHSLPPCGWARRKGAVKLDGPPLGRGVFDLLRGIAMHGNLAPTPNAPDLPSGPNAWSRPPSLGQPSPPQEIFCPGSVCRGEPRVPPMTCVWGWPSTRVQNCGPDGTQLKLSFVTIGGSDRNWRAQEGLRRMPGFCEKGCNPSCRLGCLLARGGDSLEALPLGGSCALLLDREALGRVLSEPQAAAWHFAADLQCAVAPRILRNRRDGGDRLRTRGRGFAESWWPLRAPIHPSPATEAVSDRPPATTAVGQSGCQPRRV
jgi:hypothetical protein